MWQADHDPQPNTKCNYYLLTDNSCVFPQTIKEGDAECTNLWPSLDFLRLLLCILRFIKKDEPECFCSAVKFIYLFIFAKLRSYFIAFGDTGGGEYVADKENQEMRANL